MTITVNDRLYRIWHCKSFDHLAQHCFSTDHLSITDLRAEIGNDRHTATCGCWRHKVILAAESYDRTGNAMAAWPDFNDPAAMRRALGYDERALQRLEQIGA